MSSATTSGHPAEGTGAHAAETARTGSGRSAGGTSDQEEAAVSLGRDIQKAIDYYVLYLLALALILVIVVLVVDYA
jgi:hypothetical protein